jgi:hypothetical protein
MVCKIPLKGFLIVTVGVCFLLLYATKAEAIVLHPDNEPNLLTWVDRPDSDIMGRWGENASCVAVAPNYVLTTTHQGGGIDTPVTIGGVTYSIDKIVNHPDVPNSVDPSFSVVDLRLAKLRNANLETDADIYTLTNEPNIPEHTILAGFGLGRESELTTNGILYGYSWQNRDVHKNFNLRFATNTIEAAVNEVISTSDGKKLNLDILFADFGDPCETIYEGSIAEFDSGGGWFVKSDGVWKLAAINWGVEHGGKSQSWFRDASDPNVISKDFIAGLRISSYAGWIINTMESTCQEYREADFNGDCVVDTADLSHLASMWLNTDCDESNNFCDHGDLLRDGVVDIKDFGVFARQWLSE